MVRKEEEVKSLHSKFSTYVRELIWHPSLAFRRILEEKPWGYCGFIVISTGFLGVFLWAGRLAIELPELKPIDVIFSLEGLIVSTSVISWFILSAIFHGLAKIFKGKANYWDILLVTGFLYLPIFLVNVISDVILYLQKSSIIPAFVSLAFRILAVAYIYLFLVMLALKETYSFSKAEAILAVLIFLFIVFGFSLLFLIFARTSLSEEGWTKSVLKSYLFKPTVFWKNKSIRDL